MSPAVTAMIGASTVSPRKVSASRTAGAMSETPASTIVREGLVRSGAATFGSDNARIDGWSAAAPQHA